jgi:predicted RNase H-like nuclease (RuvC/YqgF family)
MPFCPFCAHELQAQLERCEYCGKRLAHRSEQAPATRATGDEGAPPPVPAAPRRRDEKAQPASAPPPLPVPAADERATELEEVAFERVPADLPLIDAQGPAGFIGAVRYAFQVRRGRSARAQVIRKRRTELETARQKGERLLREIGEAAYASGSSCSGAEEQQRAVVSLHEKRIELERQQTALDRQLEAARQQFRVAETRCQEQTTAVRAEIGRLQSRLGELQGEVQQLKAQIARQAAQIKSLERQRDECRARAPRVAEVSEREELQQQAAEAAVQIGDLQASKAQNESQLEQRQQPIAELRVALQQQQVKLQTIARELASSHQTLKQQTQPVDQQKRSHERALEQTGRQLEESLVALGNGIDERRDQHPTLECYFERLDEHREATRELQGQIEILARECQDIDVQAYRRGVILVSIGGALLLALLLLAVVLV